MSLKPIYLSGFGVSLNVDGARLMVRDGFHMPDDLREEITVEPRHAHFDSVIIDGHSGSVSLDSIKWLMRHGIPIYLLDYDGTLLSSTLPSEPVNGPLKIAQVEAYNDSEKRFYVAKKLVEAKTQRTLDVMKWLNERYGGPSVQSDFESELQRVSQCHSLGRLLSIEGRIAEIYWGYLQHVLPSKFSFRSRMHETHQMNASDPMNTLLNYGYAILESECRKALNSVGLEPTVGFLHEPRQTKYPLVYDLQEPYRWLVDTTVISCLESGRFGRKNFYRMDNYVLRLKPEAVRRLIDALGVRFNSPVRYAGKLCSWDAVMRLKARELANHILAKRAEVDFDKPTPELNRIDSVAVRMMILSLRTSDARKLGLGKSTLHYLRENTRSERPFVVYGKVRRKLEREPAVFT